MEPIRTSYGRLTLTAPGCIDLPATAWKLEDGRTQFEAAFSVSPGEVADLISGHPLYLYQLSPVGFVPVLLTTNTETTDTPEAGAEAIGRARLESPEAVEALERITRELVHRADVSTAERPGVVAFGVLALIRAIMQSKTPVLEMLDAVAALSYIAENDPYFAEEKE